MVAAEPAPASMLGPKRRKNAADHESDHPVDNDARDKKKVESAFVIDKNSNKIDQCR
ncbi:protein of unknown function [uncultured Woeseiaceae bacterium]|uniref:Uncharacterized protein n=1 Tax=uncultured Woeseiaceae bacterium TaxID=1983305 RepID=A0A7D9D239_9GAMM|nr:protein of unknown function [uncultured Woeseiaceae bacterium]